MSDYIFENKEQSCYRVISEKDKIIVHNALINDFKSVECYYVNEEKWGAIEDNFGALMFNSVYRVLAKPKSPLDIALAELKEITHPNDFGYMDCVSEIMKRLAKRLGAES